MRRFSELKPLRVLFVAGLDPMPDGGIGGQMTVARGLFDSDLARHLRFIPLSSTMQSVPPPPLHVRAASALRRIAAFVKSLSDFDVALIFASDGLSVVEKGLMCILARACGKGVVIRLSSGNVVEQARRSSAFAIWLRLVLKCAHVVCTQGPVWSEYYARMAPGKIAEIPNAIVLPPAHATRRTSGTPMLLYVGWVMKEKGIFELLDIFRDVRGRFPKARLVIAGSGGALQEFKQRCDSAGLAASVELLGWVDKARVYELLTQADVFAFPSYAEGMPNAVLEAMAAGVPVVTSRVGGLVDLIRNGENGFAFERTDVKAMAEAALSLLSDTELARSISANAQREVSQRFDVHRVWPLYARALSRAAYESRKQSAVVFLAAENQ
jgi:glycosyltransferase involved in cell wall biosynthesis